MNAAIEVPTKGADGSFAARKVVEFIEKCGNRDADIILKTDQKPAIKFLVDDVMKNRTGAKTILEMAPKRSKGSNGVVERAVQTVEGMVGSMKSALDARF